MSKKRSWSDAELVEAVTNSKSYRAVLLTLRLVPAGGNYEQIKRRIIDLELDVSHFTGQRWNSGLKYALKSTFPVEFLLIENGKTQSYKLKNKLLLPA